MKISPVLSLVVALSAPAFASTARPAKNAASVTVAAAPSKPARATRSGKVFVPPLAAPSAAKTLTDDARAQIAVDEVRSHLKAWTSKSTKVTVRPALVPFNGDARNPITGAGPIEIFVSQDRAYKPGLFGRLRSMFSPFRNQKYLVNVDKNGSAQILDRLSLAPQARFLRFVMDKLPLGSIAHDVFSSGRMTETLFTTVGATGAAMVSPMLSGALYMRAAQVVGQAMKSQNTVRKSALDETVAWAKNEGKASAWPTLMDSYRVYQSNIEAAQEGARPLGLGAFASALAVRNL